MSDGTATRLSNSDLAPKLKRRLQRLYKQHVNNAYAMPSQHQRVTPRRQTTAAKSSLPAITSDLQNPLFAPLLIHSNPSTLLPRGGRFC